MREMGADEAPLVLGIWWPLLGMAAGIGLLIPFVGNFVGSGCRRLQSNLTPPCHVGGTGGYNWPAAAVIATVVLYRLHFRKAFAIAAYSGLISLAFVVWAYFSIWGYVWAQ